uniref:Uncharacterized protein n=1 Tax=Sus scrofa TaxID=9823 RepID=Q1XD38_PIG|nr:unknown peptide [Sus scrofa]
MTSCPRPLVTVSEDHGVDQISQATRIRVRGPAVSISTPGQLVPWYERQRGRSAVLRDLGPCLRACGIDQLSQ